MVGAVEIGVPIFVLDAQSNAPESLKENILLRV